MLCDLGLGCMSSVLIEYGPKWVAEGHKLKWFRVVQSGVRLEVKILDVSKRVLLFSETRIRTEI